MTELSTSTVEQLIIVGAKTGIQFGMAFWFVFFVIKFLTLWLWETIIPKEWQLEDYDGIREDLQDINITLQEIKSDERKNIRE
jgi:hypothetical protein